MKNIYLLTVPALFTLAAACSSSGGGDAPDGDDTDADVSSSSSSSGDEQSSSSSGDVDQDDGGEHLEPHQSSSSGNTTSSSGGTKDAGVDAQPDVVVPDACVVIATSGWVTSAVCGPDGTAECTNVFESEFTPVFANTFIDFVRVVFDPATTHFDTPYDFSLDPAVWQRDLSGLAGNSAADARYFKAESGVLKLSSYTAATSSVEGTLTDVKLVEVTYAGGVATPVPGGTCLRLTSVLSVHNAN